MWIRIAWSIELIYLAVCTRSDVRERCISVPLSIVCMGAGVLCRGVENGSWELCAEEILTCLIPGVIACVVAWISRGGFGMGDAWMIAVSACLLESTDMLLLVWYAFICAGIYGVILVIYKKKGRKDSFAFAPCMLVAYLTGMVRGCLL